MARFWRYDVNYPLHSILVCTHVRFYASHVSRVPSSPSTPSHSPNHKLCPRQEQIIDHLQVDVIVPRPAPALFQNTYQSMPD